MGRTGPRLAACLLCLALPCWVAAQKSEPRQNVPAGQDDLLAAGPQAEAFDRALPISLPAALQLAEVRPVDVQLAGARVREALADLAGARVLWLPTVYLGIDYFRHDGQIQDVVGSVFGTSKSSFMFGGAPSMVFATSDALFLPLAQRRLVDARQATLQASKNDALLAVAEAYFNVQQARGELAGAILAANRADDLVRRTRGLAEGLVPPLEVVRTRTEASRRRQLVEQARERWRTASAQLVRLLRLQPGNLVQPVEPPNLKVNLVAPEQTLDELIVLGLTYRPELAAQQALVQATLTRLKHEKLRPLMPSILVRGGSTNPAGTLSSGVFGGGVNSTLNHFGMRNDIDVQVLWEFRNLGFGNHARVQAEKARLDEATLTVFRIQDQVAAEVSQAHAQLLSAVRRLPLAEQELRDALDSVQKNFEGLSQTRRAGTLNLLVVRPQEAVAAVQALAQAYVDYFGSIADFDRAQFRLYRALGQPPQARRGPPPALAPSVLAPAPETPRTLPPPRPVDDSIHAGQNGAR